MQTAKQAQIENRPLHTNWSQVSDSDLQEWNRWAAGRSPTEILAAVATLDARIISSTSFGTESAVGLHLSHCFLPEIPVVWVDSGYNTTETYRFAKRLHKRLHLNLRTYHPLTNWPLKGNRNLAEPGVIEQFSETERDSLSVHFKREPFARAIAELRPNIWVTGIRRDETNFRRTLNVFTRGRPGVVRIAPLFQTSDRWIEQYLQQHKLPGYHSYRDIVKGEEARECGLHLV